MPFELLLPERLRSQRWKVKIFDNELPVEEPHLTVVWRRRMWRISLRTGEFLAAPGGSWNDLPPDLREAIETAWPELEEAWNRVFGRLNPVRGSRHD